MSPALRSPPLNTVAVTHVFSGRETMTSLDALTSPGFGKSMSVTHRTTQPTDAEAPSLLLDFGREIAGRVLVESNSGEESVLSIAYGESEIEAMATGLTPGQQEGNYLGTNLVDVPPHGIALGPKSGFRYVRIRFLRGAPIESYKAIRAKAIVYPVQYLGSFDSSDPLVNRIWETGAYTAHLCMQDGVWDAPKRDRGQWDLRHRGGRQGDRKRLWQPRPARRDIVERLHSFGFCRWHSRLLGALGDGLVQPL